MGQIGIGKAAGAGLGALGASQQGEAGRAEAESRRNIELFNAEVNRQAAKGERQKAAFNQKRQAKETAEIRSRLIAATAAKGGAGSPVIADLAAESASEAELENLLLGFEGEVAAKKLESGAQLDVAQASIFRKRGKAARRAGRIGAGQSLLGGFS